MMKHIGEELERLQKVNGANRAEGEETQRKSLSSGKPELIPNPESLVVRRKRSALDELAYEILCGEFEEAKAAGALGYMARILVQVTMPHRDPKESHFKRQNGGFTLSMYNDPDIGLPFGRYPRLLLAWATTEAVITKDPELYLGHSFNQFLTKLGLPTTGGKRGTIGRFRNQLVRLFSSTVSFRWDHEVEDLAHRRNVGFRISEDIDLWFRKDTPGQVGLFGSTVTLTPKFFETVVERPIPIDLRILKALKPPLALDMYIWLSYRLSYLQKTTEIPWPILAKQFGSNYKHTRQFKARAIKMLGEVLKVYPEAKISPGERGLILRPSKIHIPKLKP